MTKRQKIESLRFNPSFCTKAFAALTVTPSGAVSPCCLFERTICDENKRPYKIWENEVESFYNSSFMTEIRSKMIKGERIDACRQCYQVEDNGGISQRMTANLESYEIIEEYDSDQNYLPVSLDLKINNVCNLKCRMCQPRDSNQVHKEFKKIITEVPSFAFYSNTNMKDADLGIDLDLIPEWDGSSSFIKSLNSLLPNLKKISVVGGEPLLSQSFYDLLDVCIAQGYAKSIYIAITTNLSKVPVNKLLSYQREFKSFLINISLDATDEELSYIRYPSDFNQIKENFEKIYLPDHGLHISYQFSPTVQIYNILSLHKIFYFVEDLLEKGYRLSKTPIHITFLEYPMHLNIRILPKNAREEAIVKLRRIFRECPLLMTYAPVVLNLNQIINTLQNDFHTESDKYLQNFIHYTSVLDKERGQSFAEYLPDLFLHLSNYKAVGPIEPFYETRDRGWKLAAQDKLEEAIKLFEISLQFSEDKNVDYREMAWMKLKLKDYPGAVSAYQSAYAITPDDPYVLKGLVIALFNNKEEKKCKELLPLALEIDPTDQSLLDIVEFYKNESVRRLNELRSNPSFCTRAFTCLTITPSGAVSPCCLFERTIIDEKKRPYRIWEDEVQTFYNSPFMKNVRSKMFKGERIDGCRQCYQIEDNGGVSQRMTANHESFELIEEYDPDKEYLPISLDLKINNVCNLKCRMCQPRDSNQVHHEFKKIVNEIPKFGFYTNTKMNDIDLNLGIDLIPEWDNSPSFLNSMNLLLPNLKKISFAGGEPLLSQSFYRLMDLCIASNRAPHIYIAITTNLTKVPFEKLLRYQHEFHSFLFNISLDAMDEELFYIRYPTEIKQVWDNFEKIYVKDHSDLVAYQFSPTVQVYNILSLDKIFYFVEKFLERGFVLSNTPIHTTFLEYPAHLNIRILPRNVREVAISRLEEIQQRCPLLMSYPTVKSNVQQIINTLRQEKHPMAEKYLHHFMYYTAVLDRERNQSFSTALPDLHKLIAHVIPVAPVEPFVGNHKRGWFLTKLFQTYKFMIFLKTVFKSPIHSKLSFTKKLFMVLERLNGFSITFEDYKEALQVAPENPHVLKGIVLHFFERKDFVKSRMLLPLAVEKNPHDKELQAMVDFFMKQKKETN